MIHHSRSEDQRRRIERELVDMLAEMPLLQASDSRQQMMQKLRTRLRQRGDIADIPNPRRQSLEIARICLDVPHELVALLEVVALFDPAAAELPQLERLRYELDVIDVLPESDWTELRPVMLDISLSPVTRLYQRAIQDKLFAPPQWCENVWDLFVYLGGQNAPADGLPPDMLFLVLLEEEVDSEVGALIRRRNQRRGTEIGVTFELERRRAAVKSGVEQPDPYVYLVIQVEPDFEPGLEPDLEAEAGRYTISHYKQWRSGTTWHSQMRDRVREVPYPALQPTVERIIHETEVDWSARREEVAIELVLPVALLNEDVAWWCKERASPYLPQKVLAMDHTVVVRSLERLRRPEWHWAWRKRWKLLNAEPTRSTLYRSQPSGAAYPTRLEAELNLDWSYSTMLLSAPATDTNAKEEIMTALRAGLPAIVWHRTEPPDDTFLEEVRTMTGEGRVVELPTHVRKSRLTALRLEPPESDQHVGRHLMVLWDDPDRTPELDETTGVDS
ncbi:effector-associated domain 2-containing protein [Plantactinospora sp. CA-294935]|uniref:VMAP-C domain-containing protein n=1 Tax=Plantactinospora sp. CA-294935 TaxID=3240012 RepID=UPI003D91ECBE